MLKLFICCADQFDTPHDILHHYFPVSTSWKCPCSPSLTSWSWGTGSWDSPNRIVLPMLTNLIPRMTYFITIFHLMVTMINFLKLGNLFMWLPKCNCAPHADQFDTLHDLLHHYFAPHGVVRAHHDQLLEVKELVQVTQLACLCSSRSSFWCPTCLR